VNSRILASLALGATAALALTGCAGLTHQATTIPYSPSDGVNVAAPESGAAPIVVRNAVIIADAHGTDGNLAASVVNNSDEDAELSLEWGDGQTATLDLEAGEALSLGAGSQDPILLEGINSEAGSTLPLYFQSGDVEGVLAEVPVLNGCLAHFKNLVPGGYDEADCEHLAPVEGDEEEGGH